MRKLIYEDKAWIPVQPDDCERRREKLKYRWQAHAKRLQHGEALRLRDISAIINTCQELSAYNFCLDAYRAYIRKRCGTVPDIRRVACIPLFTLLNAPPLTEEKIPIFVGTLRNQAYISKDWKNLQSGERKLLICTTSRTHTLSMPLQIFQAYAGMHFNAIAYLFDRRQSHYRQCRKETFACVNGIIDQLEPGIVGFSGTSAGGCIAMELMACHKGTRALAGSPVFDRAPELCELLNSHKSADIYERTRITHGDNAIDSQFSSIYNAINHASGSRVTYNMSYISPTHGSLGVATLNGLFQELLCWVASPLSS